VTRPCPVDETATTVMAGAQYILPADRRPRVRRHS
jgi:hypothetical protein